MIGGRVVFIIPGYRQSAKNKAYCEIARTLKFEGYSPIPVKISWKDSTISDNVEYFLKVYKKIKARKKYILGFSYGAMIAFIASTNVRSAGLVLCSLSPYFSEDVSKPRIKQRVRTSLAQSRFEDFAKLHCETLAKKTKAKKILMLYGALEARSLVRRVRKTFDQIPSTQKNLVRISKTEHEIGNKKYINTIRETLGYLI